MTAVASRLSEGTQKCAIWPKNLDSVVTRVANDDMALRIDCNALRSRELTTTRTLKAKKLRRSKIISDDDNPVIVEVRDDHVTWEGLLLLDDLRLITILLL